ncbi:MAG: hypothetical protein CVV33_02995 [Methanomicrobiales archaeon HGW-Methanomicrobiales-4]|nr:MAG: hypothetical protein CVV33_02995 [Methanomicrobiales archaeon HGW-Methanomicrobiales-4]
MKPAGQENYSSSLFSGKNHRRFINQDDTNSIILNEDNLKDYPVQRRHHPVGKIIPPIFKFFSLPFRYIVGTKFKSDRF